MRQAKLRCTDLRRDFRDAGMGVSAVALASSRKSYPESPQHLHGSLSYLDVRLQGKKCLVDLLYRSGYY
jgi:hypothetical protein